MIEMCDLCSYFVKFLKCVEFVDVDYFFNFIRFIDCDSYNGDFLFFFICFSSWYKGFLFGLKVFWLD